MLHFNRLAKVLMTASVIASTLVLSILGNSSVARASANTFVVTSGPGVNICGTGAFYIPETLNIVTTTSYRVTLTAPGYGVIYNYTYDITAPYTAFQYYVGSRATSVPAGTLITFTRTFYNGTGETGGVDFSVSVQFDCTTGQLYQGPGPQVPGGFAMKQVTCTSPVYSQPGGSPVGSAQVTAGQRWYINPIPVKDSTGKSWTELFDAGYTDGFIPTSCVNMGFNYVYGVN